MKPRKDTLILAAFAVLFTLPLAGCSEDSLDVAAVPEPEPGDPAFYAPDGWPLQIGDRISSEEWRRLYTEFRLPWPGPIVDRSGYWPQPRRGVSLGTPWDDLGLNLVGDRVYAAMIGLDDEQNLVYRGHFRIRFRESMRHFEPELPSEYHGKVEYYTGRPPMNPNRKIGDPPPNTLAWPDYYSGVRR